MTIARPSAPAGARSAPGRCPPSPRRPRPRCPFVGADLDGRIDAAQRRPRRRCARSSSAASVSASTTIAIDFLAAGVGLPALLQRLAREERAGADALVLLLLVAAARDLVLPDPPDPAAAVVARRRSGRRRAPASRPGGSAGSGSRACWPCPRARAAGPRSSRSARTGRAGAAPSRWPGPRRRRSPSASASSVA